ncbi:protein pygopus-like isoform X2 [Planococcus citri]|uniref:protein pygopus-like isoform X2 n=1 Tax=Planococcus citri TaxID=170843 RepID=UPI0031F9F030
MKRMPRGRSQMPFYGHAPCPDNDMPHMQRGPCFTDGYGKMDGPCGMGVGEFKSPMMANPEPPPPPPKKKRRTSNTMAAAPPPPQSPAMQDLLPPPLTGYGDTIVASNPFDDTPPPTPTMSHMNPMNHVNKHMNVGPCMSPAASMMGSMSPCHIVGSPMNCGPPVGSPINCGPSMGNCSPMPGGGNNPNCGPIGSPHAVCNTRQVSRSPLMCPPMSNAGSVMNCGPGSNNPMNVNSVHSMNRSPQSLGSPLSSVMASNVRGNSPLDCGLGLNSIGSQKGSPMSVMSSHNMNSLNCGSPMGSPSNVQMNNCNNGGMNMGSPITSPLGNVPCSMQSGPDLGMNLNGVMSRSPMNAPPNSVGSPMLCNSTMRGQSPLGGGPLGNSPMNMNCNSNPNVGIMGPKSDLNMNELAAMGRDNCGPGHISMKSNQGPGCVMPMNNPCSRPSDMNSMQPCGPGQMNNSPHCNPMMNNPGGCGPGMNNLPCIGNNMNRPPCGVNPMSMGNPYDGMNPQCRPNMNRSQYPRHMNSMHYGGPPPNSMNSMCGPPDMGNMPCPPNNQMHCNDQAMNNPQCGVNQNMNQCGGNMFNSPFSPFDSRCSPNLPFNEVSMNNGGGFYRNMNHTSQAPCMPNMRNPCNVSSASDLPGPGDMSAIKTESRDHSDLSADISNTVCGLTSSDNNDDLGLMSCGADNFLKEDRKPKDCNGGLSLEDEADKLDDVKNKLDLDKKDAIVKIKDEKIDGKEDDDVKTIISPSSSGASSQGPTNTITVTSASTTSGTTTSSSVTSADPDNNDNSTANATSEGVKNDTEDDLFKSSDGVNSGAGNTNNESENNRSANETNDKDDSEDKLHCSNENDTSFDDNVDNTRDDKNSSANNESADATNSNCPESENTEDRNKENDSSTPIKLENDEFFDGVKNVSDLGTGAPSRPGNNFSNGNVIPTSNFGPGNDVSGVMNNPSSCMSDTMCTSSVMPNMNRTIMSNAMNHSMNYPTNRPVNIVYPSNKSKVYNPQNPNAPPIYACGHCHKEVNDNDQAVLCESGCNFWYHRTCSGLTEPAYQLLTAEIYAEWVCDKCLTTKKIPLVKFKP